MALNKSQDEHFDKLVEFFFDMAIEELQKEARLKSRKTLKTSKK